MRIYSLIININSGFSNKVLQIVSSGQFEAITLIFILLNSAMFAIDNPEID